MTREELRARLLGMLGAIAPEADLSELDPKADVREALDLDSMDFLGLATRIHRELGIDVPETDAAQLATLEGCVDYLARRIGI